MAESRDLLPYSRILFGVGQCFLFFIDLLSIILLLQSRPQQIGKWHLFWFLANKERWSHNIEKILVLTERHIYSFSDYFPVLLQSFPVLCNLARGEISRIMLVQCGSSRFAEDSLAHTIAIACTVYSRCKASFMGLKRRWCFFEKRTQDGKINLSWCKVGVKQL